MSRRTLRILTVSSLLVLSMSRLPAQPATFVTTRGSQIVGTDGKPLLLRGINLGNWLVPEGYMFQFRKATSPRMIDEVVTQLIGPEEGREFWRTFRANYVTLEDIRHIRDLGLNSVRVPFHYRLFLPDERVHPRPGPGFALMDSVVSWCRSVGLYVILDMHCAPGGQTGDNIDDSWGYPFLFDSPAEQDVLVDVWRSIAERYAGEPTVIGYDLMNEPIAHYFDVDRLNPKLEPLYKRIVSAIRDVDASHIIFLGGARWNTNFSVFGPPFDARLVYTFHKYWMPPVQESIQEYVDFRERYNVPVWMGESGENTDSWVDSFRVVLEMNDVGWCFWPYKRMDAERCIRRVVRPDGWDIIAAFADGPRSSFQELCDNRPDASAARRVLGDYLEAVKFRKCVDNEGYIKALGLTSSR